MSGGRIITVFAAKGGSGKTSLATNLAAALCAGGTDRVCLVDLDLHFGDVACSLGLSPERSMYDAVQRADGLTLARIAELATPYRPGLDCLLAPAGPGAAAQITPTLVAEVLSVLPMIYGFVVIDCPSTLNGVVLAALDAAHHQVVVATAERPALRSLRATLDLLDFLYDAGNRSIVVNKTDPASSLSPSDVSRLIKTPIAAALPAANEIPASINRAEPLTYAYPDHPVSQAICRFAHGLASTDGQPVGWSEDAGE